ncbi:sec-independent protein translocase protein TatA [Thiohalospira halophila DSM 15071]|uniref:Sec-independent protein translocase protein TatA n=1 Tax=Thiohalospira halophila DSM 15071 TaxID=1123397 RepID=A0A1I1TF30_9GAMM|nr:twin-arginine translocase TatA/TatE family subunit [Thiohalospira halophila]SFD57176.1 sec-independent protein translocase protein TatA [Thiohalospira halophila DSM 15071]
MGISVWQLLIILAIVLVLFGAKRLRNVGGDLGAAVKGFRSAVSEEGGDKDKEKNESDDPEKLQAEQDEEGHVINGEAREESEKADAEKRK